MVCSVDTVMVSMHSIDTLEAAALYYLMHADVDYYITPSTTSHCILIILFLTGLARGTMVWLICSSCKRRCLTRPLSVS